MFKCFIGFASVMVLSAYVHASNDVSESLPSSDTAAVTPPRKPSYTVQYTGPKPSIDPAKTEGSPP